MLRGEPRVVFFLSKTFACKVGDLKIMSDEQNDTFDEDANSARIYKEKSCKNSDGDPFGLTNFEEVD